MKAKKNTVYRAIRGGCYDYVTGVLRVTYRSRVWQEGRYWNNGFRLVIRKKT